MMDPAGVEKRDIGGVALLGIDNTQYQVNERQLEVLRKILSEQTPCILFMHIPLYLPTLEKAVMDFWKSPIVMGIPEHLCAERQPGIIHSPQPTAVTREFWRLCNETPNLRAVFGGHLHFSHEDAMLSGNPQYVTSPGYGGGCRLIDLIPAE
ncbi:MAG: hypothetical protein FWF15_11810 [Oscillospiraceae bacterium]|nr:hypothetical protein [Oscillospiraceae bacterium]